MRRFVVSGILSFLVLSCASAPSAPPEPITVLSGGRIFTSDRNNLWAEAVAIQGERIVAVGSNADVLAAAQQKSKNVTLHPLGGRVVVPGFNDAHFHGGVYPDHVAVELSGQDPEMQEVRAKLAEATAANPPEKWLLAEVAGRVMNDPSVNRAALDGISTTHPILVASWAGHGSIANSRALELIGFGDSMKDPMGGKLGRTADGRLDGRLDEYAGYLAVRNMAGFAPEQKRIDNYARLAKLFVARGMTSIQDMANVRPASEVSAYLTQAAVPLRWRVIRFPMTTAESFGADAERGALPPGSHPGAKWIVDGTPVERGAAMSVPYADAPASKGTLNFSQATIEKMLAAADAHGEQPMFHAVGDAAVEAVLDALDATGGPSRWKAKRVRIEHGDLATAAQIARMRGLGVVYVQNPAHLTLTEMMSARFARRDDVIQPMRSIVSGGVVLAIGSDGPTNPFLNLMFATLHPVTPSEALTREEAVIAYTYGSAYAEHAENEKGTLTAGKLADLAVLSADIFTLPPDQLPAVKSVLTMIGGRIVHGSLTQE